VCNSVATKGAEMGFEG